MTTCEFCGRFEAVMEDPTFDVERVVASARATAVPMKVCELCAKERIESEMMRLGQVIQ